MRARIPSREESWSVELLETRLLLAAVDVRFQAANYSSQDPSFSLQGPSSIHIRRLQMDTGSYQPAAGAIFDPKGVGSAQFTLPPASMTRTSPRSGTATGTASSVLLVLALKGPNPAADIDKFVTSVLIPSGIRTGLTLQSGPDAATIDWKVEGGVFDGKTFTLDGETFRMRGEGDNDEFVQSDSVNFFKVFRVGTNPDGNSEFVYLELQLVTQIETDDPDVLPLPDVASGLLHAPSVDEYHDTVLAQFAPNLKYAGAVPDTLLLYDFSGKSTIPPGTLPYVNQYELTTPPVQGEAACGPSSLTMGLTEVGTRVSVQAAWDHTIHLPPQYDERGFGWKEGESYVKTLGHGGLYNEYDKWANVEANLNAARPVLISNKLSTTNKNGDGHVILLLGVGRNQDVKSALKQLDPSLSGDYYIVADPAGHFFANPDVTGAHYGTVQDLRTLAVGLNYGGWFAVYPKEKLREKVEFRDKNGLVVTRTLTIDPAAPAISLGAHSPVAVVVTDPLGRKTGILPDGSVLNEIPDSEYHVPVVDDSENQVSYLAPEEGQFVILVSPAEGTYTARLTGTGSGPFRFDIEIQRPGQPPSLVSYSGTASPGSSDTYTFSYPPGAVPGAEVVGRSVFYNNSSYDGNAPGADPRDDAAVAPDKQALRPGQGPGQGANFSNVTSFIKGINGVMVDVRGLPATSVLTSDAFTFRTGTTPDPSAWADGPRPASVDVRRGAGVGGSDRIALVWPDGAIRNTWLQVTLAPGALTGLAGPDVFYFGNLAGDTGDGATSFRVSALDLAAVKRALNTTSALPGRLDFNRDGRVNSLDLSAARGNLNRSLGGVTLAPAAGVASSAPPAPRALWSPPFIDSPAVTRLWDDPPGSILS